MKKSLLVVIAFLSVQIAQAAEPYFTCVPNTVFVEKDVEVEKKYPVIQLMMSNEKTIVRDRSNPLLRLYNP